MKKIKRKPNQTEAAFLVEIIKYHYRKHGYGDLSNTNLAYISGYTPTNMSSLIKRSAASSVRFFRAMAVLAEHDLLSEFEDFYDDFYKKDDGGGE